MTITSKNRITIDPEDAAPLWRQIEEGMRHLVASRRLPPGSAVPSVRELAQDLQVNPATVSKAYQRLTQAGVLEVRRGDGTYVQETPPALGAAEQRRILEEAARRYAAVAVSLGCELELVVGVLAETYWNLQDGKGDG